MNPTPVPTGSDVQVNTYTNFWQQRPTVAALADGGFVVTWTSTMQDDAGSFPSSGIYGQRYASDGTRVGGEFHVNTFTPGEQSNSSVVGLAGGGYVITWQSAIQDILYGQRYAADGTPAGTEFRINPASSQARGAALGALDDGGFVVMWNNLGDGSARGQRYSADGLPIGGSFFAGGGLFGEVFPSAVTTLGDGGFLATLTYSAGESSRVSIRRYDANGADLGGLINVGINPHLHPSQYEFQYGASATALEDGSFVVAWTDERPGQPPALFVQRFSVDGTAGPFVRANTTLFNTHQHASVTALDDGGFLVTWTSFDGDGLGVFGRRFAADGTALGRQFLVNQTIVDFQESQSQGETLATLPDGRIVQVWAGNSEGIARSEIFYRFIDVAAWPPPVALTPDRLIDASEIDDASFTLRGLRSNATAIVTFSDGINQVASAVLSANGTYSIDLSSLGDGPLVSSVKVTDAHGNSTTWAGTAAKINTSTSIDLTLAELLALGETETAAFTDIAVTAKSQMIRRLSPSEIANLGAAGVTSIDATDDRLTLSVAQYDALRAAGIAFGADDFVTLLDTNANLQSVLGTSLAGEGVDRLDASNNILSLTVAQYQALDVVLTPRDRVILADTGANIAATDGALGGFLVDVLDATDDMLTLSAAQAAGLYDIKLTAGDIVTLADTGANIAALSLSQLAALSGVDAVDASDDALALSLAQFGALRGAAVAAGDALTVFGTSGNDRFRFAGQRFGAEDGVVGGPGNDTLILDGDYSAGLAFAAGALASIEALAVLAGNDYDLTMHAENVGPGAMLAVSAANLGAGDALTFDGSAEDNGTFRFLGGAGTAIFTGGDRGDWLELRSGGETLRYTAGSQSTGLGLDTVAGFDAAADSFDVGTGITMDAAITTGALHGGAAFDAGLTAAMVGLAANHGVLFTPDAGGFASTSLLVLNIDGVAGYQSGSDLVIRLSGTTGTLTNANFV